MFWPDFRSPFLDFPPSFFWDFLILFGGPFPVFFIVSFPLLFFLGKAFPPSSVLPSFGRSALYTPCKTSLVNIVQMGLSLLLALLKPHQITPEPKKNSEA